MELSEESDFDCDGTSFKTKDFIVVRVYSSNKTHFRHYIAQIVLPSGTGVRVCFFKRVRPTWKFEKTPEYGFVVKADMIRTLKTPTMCSSDRFQGMIQFPDDLTDFSLY